MRILHIVPTLGYGGVAKVIINYYEKMNHEKYQFDFIAHGVEKNIQYSLLKENCSIFKINSIREIGIFNYVNTIGKILKSRHYDIVHIHIGHLTGVYALICRLFGAKKIVLHAHSGAIPNKKHEIFMPILRIMTAIFSDKLIACSQTAGKFCFGEKAPFIILNNGIDFDKVMHITEEDIERKKTELCIKPHQKIIGHVGAFVKVKNHGFLLEIFRELVSQVPNTVLILVGDGPERVSIEQFIKNNKLESNVKLLGKRDDVLCLMSIFDLFLLPSLSEGLPVVGVESQSTGTFSLISNQVDESLDLGIGCIEFVDINDTNKWVEIIKREIFNVKKVDKSKILDGLMKNGFEINSSVKILENTYCDLQVKNA